MGIYLNPGNRGFQTILNGNYVDKTGLIYYVNSTVNTKEKYEEEDISIEEAASLMKKYNKE